jgi:hypothetical protein|tara:strand:- start:1097 stop:1327 length:231 start_codon:yes stop_codon:yes gene_type:complete
MRVVKDPFTGDLLLSLDSFESKQVKDKGYVKISTTNNYFGSLRVLYEDLSTILTEELRTIQTLQEKKRHEKLLNKK